MALTRHCRALDCPRRVPRRVLFCNVHWRQLPPRYSDPIRHNQEPPKHGTINDARNVVNGTRAAVAYLARKEHKGTDLKEALAAAASAPATGTTAEDTAGLGGASAAAGSGGGSTSQLTSRV